ncbi:uncharacterized protein N7482_008431 [Penicillium canariense]|uniref:Uncharacterized protein n=1 Tax=Penicillium canariense TaxID=189055 RepID=A0A9W9LHH4_9EURO|nr:uncharacterized protein N7482_008431 [Penicillium canariense]KAJ5157331.1 hypothetical protein N7482_008431 [Penicillium canariense]
MDLSSLEGPPLADFTAPRIQEPQSPQAGAHYDLSKLLPARTASADPTAPGQLRQRLSHSQASGSTNPFWNDGPLRRTPAQKGRRCPSNELLPGRNTGTDPVREPRPRSPSVNPYQYTECRVPRRSRSAPLIWLENEELWVVTDGWPASRSPTRRSQPPRLEISTAERGTMPVDDDLDRLAVSPPPSYDSHCFRPAHVTRQQHGMESRWGAVARRMHNLSLNR